MPVYEGFNAHLKYILVLGKIGVKSEPVVIGGEITFDPCFLQTNQLNLLFYKTS
jgi:hypothetical protein